MNHAFFAFQFRKQLVGRIQICQPFLEGWDEFGIPPERGVEYVLYPRAKELPPRKTVYRLKREFFDKDRESP